MNFDFSEEQIALRGLANQLGVLADVVPTLCQACDIPLSEGMDGHSLFEG